MVEDISLRKQGVQYNKKNDTKEAITLFYFLNDFIQISDAYFTISHIYICIGTLQYFGLCTLNVPFDTL